MQLIVVSHLELPVSLCMHIRNLQTPRHPYPPALHQSKDRVLLGSSSSPPSGGRPQCASEDGMPPSRILGTSSVAPFDGARS